MRDAVFVISVAHNDPDDSMTSDEIKVKLKLDKIAQTAGTTREKTKIIAASNIIFLNN